MKICVAGQGAFGQKHLDALKRIQGVEVTSLVGGNQDSTAEFAKKYGIPHFTGDLSEGIKRADAVILTTPTKMHFRQGEQVMRAGKHVLVEIPVTDSVEDAENLVKIAKETGVTAMGGHVRRFNPKRNEYIHKKIAKGELKIQQMDVQTYFFRRKNINAAGNARSWTDHLLWHHAAHTIDLFQYQAGENISDCYAVQGPIHPQLNIAMDMGIVAKTPSGTILTLSLSFNNDGPIGSFFRYIGDTGTYKAFYDDLSDGKDNKIDVSKVDVSMDGIELEDREFIAAIKEKREPNGSLAARRRACMCSASSRRSSIRSARRTRKDYRFLRYNPPQKSRHRQISGRIFYGRVCPWCCGRVDAGGVFGYDACAEDAYPTKPVHLYVPYPPGGAVDIVARTLGDALGKAWNQSVVVENRPGAAGIIAEQALVQAAPDGYTLILVASGHALSPHFYDKLPYDTFKDFTPISQIGSSPNMLLVRADSPFKSVGDVIAAARAKPGHLVLRPCRQRHFAISLRRTVQIHGQGPDHAGAVQRRRAGFDRSHRRPNSAVLQQHSGIARPGSGRRGAAARRDDGGAFADPAQRADHRRGRRARLRHRRLVGRVCARRSAAGDPAKARASLCRRGQDAGHGGEAQAARRHADRLDLGRARQGDARRIREVGTGDQSRRPQDRVAKSTNTDWRPPQARHAASRSSSSSGMPG